MISPIFGYPRQIYMDNVNYFTNPTTKEFFVQKGTTPSHGPLYAPYSHGLMVRIKVRYRLKFEIKGGFK